MTVNFKPASKLCSRVTSRDPLKWRARSHTLQVLPSFPATSPRVSRFVCCSRVTSRDSSGSEGGQFQVCPSPRTSH